MRNVVKQWESDRETVGKRRKNLQLLDNRFSTASLLLSSFRQPLNNCFQTASLLFASSSAIASQCFTIA
jgi:hypothetical protein